MASSPLGSHSYDPGFPPTGVVWITSVPPGAIQVDLKSGTASLVATNISTVFDAFTVGNSLDPTHPLGQPVPSTINSLEIEWSGAIRQGSFSNPPNTVAGIFVETSAQIAVETTTPPGDGKNGFHFVSDPLGTSGARFAQICHEKNGVFFPA